MNFDLDSLEAVRPACKHIFDFVKSNQSEHFTLHLERLAEVAALVKKVSSDRYPAPLVVPYHSRLRHLPAEACGLSAEALFDLVTVSVLLDAGAGANWKFEYRGNYFARSEGLGVASFAMFTAGLFGRDAAGDPALSAQSLVDLSATSLAAGLQISSHNPLLGLENRKELLCRLGERLVALNYTRPSDLLKEFTGTENKVIEMSRFWQKVFNFIIPVFPKKDIHLHKATDTQVPFHKLLQWLMYSYVEVLERNFHCTVHNKALQTGLPEYRNGGLFVDLGVLELKTPTTGDCPFAVSSDLVIEWRACTVVLLDLLREKYFFDLPLACLLEGGTWAAGRVVAKNRRPESGDSPIPVLLDGTVF